MFNYDWIGFLIVFVFTIALSATAAAKQFPKRFTQLVLLGFLIHAVGSLVRYAVLYGYYDGGDAGRYYRFGLKYADMFWTIGLSTFDRQYWDVPRWWGTQITMWITAITITLIGPTKRGAFLVFAFFAFIALLLFSKTFEKNFKNASLKKYMMWLLLWPSLWFWPSSIGKDALILLATALVVYGYARKENGMKWIALLFGLTLAFVIRPQVAGILAVSLGVAHWFSPGRQFGAVHYFQGLLILIVLFFVVRQGMSTIGLEAFDIDDVRGYLEESSRRSNQGGGAIGTPTFGISGIGMAFVNILFRPFLWEASNPLWLAASLEMMVFWVTIVRRRKTVHAVLKQWRRFKLLRLAIPLTILYVVGLGLAVGNLGIIARQRIHIMPLLLVWLEAVPLTAAAIQSMKRPRWTPVPLTPRLPQKQLTQ